MVCCRFIVMALSVDGWLFLCVFWCRCFSALCNSDTQRWCCVHQNITTTFTAVTDNKPQTTNIMEERHICLFVRVCFSSAVHTQQQSNPSPQIHDTAIKKPDGWWEGKRFLNQNPKTVEIQALIGYRGKNKGSKYGKGERWEREREYLDDLCVGGLL